jgi:hypothetical protein
VGLWLHSQYSLGLHLAGKGGTVPSEGPKGLGSEWMMGQ